MRVPARPFALGSKPRLSRRYLSSLGRSYADAIDALNSLQTPYEVVEERRRRGIRPDASSVREMTTYLRRIGYQPQDLDRLNVIHVAGTKGKGTTCAYVDAILARYRQRGRLGKTGLFLSPHLIAVRERIRIDGLPLPEDLFARYFFEVWDRLGAAAPSSSSSGAAQVDSDGGGDIPRRPAYARYLTLMSWHVFLQESVSAAVYETGIGGEFDATNLVPRPLVAGISTLGIDHVFALGDTIGKIAWHKAGVIKKGAPAFTTTQVPEAEEVLRQRAAEKEVDLQILSVDERLRDVVVKPDAEFQRKNATLAVALAEAALVKLGVLEGTGLGPKTLPTEFVEGIERTAFRGRCETKEEETVRWHLDGAHTADSLRISAKWFADEVAGRPGPRVMIFNQQSRTEALDFLTSIRDATRRSETTPSFDHVIFCTNVTRPTTGYGRDFVNRQHDPDEVRSLAVQRRFAAEWARLDPGADVRVLPTIEEALECARRRGDALRGGHKIQAFVTGSLHLVGGALGILEGADAL